MRVTPEIPDRTFFKIGEVSQLVGVKPHIIRYWESEFRNLRLTKTKSGQRLFRRRDIEILLAIRALTHDLKFTVAGARERLKELLDAEVPTGELVAVIHSMGQPASTDDAQLGLDGLEGVDAAVPLAAADSLATAAEPVAAIESPELLEVREELEALQETHARLSASMDRADAERRRLRVKVEEYENLLALADVDRARTVALENALKRIESEKNDAKRLALLHQDDLRQAQSREAALQERCATLEAELQQARGQGAALEARVREVAARLQALAHVGDPSKRDGHVPH